MSSLAVLAVLTALAADPDPLAKANEHLARAQTALEKKDYATFTASYEAAIAAGADHPRLWYNLACGYALLGDAAKASAALGKLADLGLYEDAAADADFAKIKETPAFREVLARLEKNKAPTARSRKLFELDDPKIRAEGVSRDPADGAYYLGSFDQKRIVRADEKGRTTTFSSPEDGLSEVLGLAIDHPRRELWAASGGGLFRYDLKSKKLVKKYLLPTDGKPHGLGDVIVASNGDTFTTDSLTSGIYRIRAGGDKLESLGHAHLFRSPQGLCLSPDEKTLFVADYSRGVYAIDRATPAIRKLTVPKNASVAGIDGLYFYRDRLIATQNGVRPNRVLALFLDRDRRAIERVEILESNHALFEEPRLGYIAADQLNYVAGPGLILELNLVH